MVSYPLLINKSNPLSPYYTPAPLTEPAIPFQAPPRDERRLLQKDAAKAVTRLFTQAALDGMGLVGISGYRSYKRQTELYNDALRRRSTAVAPPGTSEHQSGLALDVSCPAVNLELEEAFADTAEGKWLKKHAPLYGFILRYPCHKESVTGYPWEPWHIRFVGETLALYLSLTGLTLEEFHSYNCNHNLERL